MGNPHILRPLDSKVGEKKQWILGDVTCGQQFLLIQSHCQEVNLFYQKLHF